MWNVVNNIKTLELVWPFWMPAAIVCRALDRLEDGLVRYWELFWDSEEEVIGIRFASRRGGMEVLQGHTVRFADGYAVGKRECSTKECDLATTIDEYESTVARIYDVGNPEDLAALSGNGHHVGYEDGRVLVGVGKTDFAGCWVVEVIATQCLIAEAGAVSLERIARDYGGELKE